MLEYGDMNTAPYKAKLEAEKARLERELTAIGSRNPENPNDWEPAPPQSEFESDPVDAADLTIGFDRNASVVADLETRYGEVAAALDRIEEGAYGICTIGKEPIEEDRLNADPAATTCKKHLA